MTRDETKKIIGIILAAYPSWKAGMSDEMLGSVIDVWSKVLENDDARLIEAGLMDFIKNDTSGFAPSIGQIRWFQKQAEFDAQLKAQDEAAKLEKKAEPKRLPPRIPADKKMATPEFIDSLKAKSKLNWR